jgi:predicted DsbA family dithiol-disulfide isomerase
MNDLLFDLAGKEKELNLENLAAKTGLESAKLARALNSQGMQQRLKIDIWTALKLRMVGTPSFKVNGKAYQGQLPPEIFKKVLG